MTKVTNGGELRIPTDLVSKVLAEKKIKALHVFTAAKLEGHRCLIKDLCKTLKIHDKTCGRVIKDILDEGWAGTDGLFLFPRSWNELSLNRKGGLYISNNPINLKMFESLCFCHVLKKVIRRKAGPRPNKGRTEQTGLPTAYLYKALGISERRYERLKATSRKYRLISVKSQFTIVGYAHECSTIRKHLMDRPVFVRGKHTVVPGPSKIKVLI